MIIPNRIKQTVSTYVKPFVHFKQTFGLLHSKMGAGAGTHKNEAAWLIYVYFIG
jgi:hypothetical protein